MKKKDVALAFGITGSYVDILANTLIGLKKHSKKFWDDIIIFHEGITLEQQKYLNMIVECKFKELKSRDFLKYVRKEQIEMYSVATFFRFESFSLLDEYKKVIWSDVDVLYQKDISSLVQYGDKTGYAATYAPAPYRVENNFFGLLNEYNMFTKMINAGLYVITDKLSNYKEIQKWCYSSTIKYGDKLRWLDQAILNIMVQHFNIQVEEIELEKYHCHPTFKNYIKSACIVHAHGLRKFWNDIEFQKLFPEWYENHNSWLKIYPHEASKLIHDYLPLVSVVMSVYERYDFLEEAVQSILKQTYKNLELIVVVEKSKNQRRINNLLKKIKDQRLIIINNEEKLGFSASLNIGIAAAKGKYIARMDDDDISLKERIEKQVQYMEDNLDIGISDTNAEFFMHSKGLWYYNNPTSEEIKTVLLVTNPICHPSVIMRKSVLDDNNLRYDPEYFSEDYQLWSRAIKYTKIGHIDEVLLKYRASNKNVTSNASSNDKIQISIKKTIYNEMKDYLDLELCDNELELIQRRINIVKQSCNSESALDLQKKAYKKIIDRNNQIGFYDKRLIKILFSDDDILLSNNKDHNIKSLIKKLLRPFYRPISSFLDRKINYIVGLNLIDTNNRLDVLQASINGLKKSNVSNKKDNIKK